MPNPGENPSGTLISEVGVESAEQTQQQQQKAQQAIQQSQILAAQQAAEQAKQSQTFGGLAQFGGGPSLPTQKASTDTIAKYVGGYQEPGVETPQSKGLSLGQANLEGVQSKNLLFKQGSEVVPISSGISISTPVQKSQPVNAPKDTGFFSLSDGTIPEKPSISNPNLGIMLENQQIDNINKSINIQNQNAKQQNQVISNANNVLAGNNAVDKLANQDIIKQNQSIGLGNALIDVSTQQSKQKQQDQLKQIVSAGIIGNANQFDIFSGGVKVGSIRADRNALSSLTGIVNDSKQPLSIRAVNTNAQAAQRQANLDTISALRDAKANGVETINIIGPSKIGDALGSTGTIIGTTTPDNAFKDLKKYQAQGIPVSLSIPKPNNENVGVATGLFSLNPFEGKTIQGKNLGEQASSVADILTGGAGSGQVSKSELQNNPGATSFLNIFSGEQPQKQTTAPAYPTFGTGLVTGPVVKNNKVNIGSTSVLDVLQFAPIGGISSGAKGIVSRLVKTNAPEEIVNIPKVVGVKTSTGVFGGEANRDLGTGLFGEGSGIKTNVRSGGGGVSTSNIPTIPEEKGQISTGLIGNVESSSKSGTGLFSGEKPKNVVTLTPDITNQKVSYISNLGNTGEGGVSGKGGGSPSLKGTSLFQPETKTTRPFLDKEFSIGKVGAGASGKAKALGTTNVIITPVKPTSNTQQKTTDYLGLSQKPLTSRRVQLSNEESVIAYPPGTESKLTGRQSSKQISNTFQDLFQISQQKQEQANSQTTVQKLQESQKEQQKQVSSFGFDLLSTPKTSQGTILGTISIEKQSQKQVPSFLTDLISTQTTKQVPLQSQVPVQGQKQTQELIPLLGLQPTYPNIPYRATNPPGFLGGGIFGFGFSGFSAMNPKRKRPARNTYGLWGTSPTDVGVFYSKGVSDFTVSSDLGVIAKTEQKIQRVNPKGSVLNFGVQIVKKGNGKRTGKMSKGIFF